MPILAGYKTVACAIAHLWTGLKSVLFRGRSRWPLFLVYQRMFPHVLGKAIAAEAALQQQYAISDVELEPPRQGSAEAVCRIPGPA